MVAYFISIIDTPEKPTDFQIDLKEFINVIGKTWKDAKFETNLGKFSPYTLIWRLRNGEYGIMKHGNSIYLSDEISYVADFALWYRKYVLDKHRLIIYDESFSSRIELASDTTKEQIFAGLGLD
jgi:hypothetical protein